MTKPPKRKGGGFVLPETPVINNGFKKGVTGDCLNNLDDPNEEYNLNIGERGRVVITVMQMEKTVEEINQLHKYNCLVGRCRISTMGYRFED